MRRLLSATMVCLAAASPLSAQVRIAPTTVVVGARQPFGTYLVGNASGVAQEIAIDFRYGYPASDSLGSISMVYDDSVSAGRYSMTEWVRAFPRRFVLEPGQQQLVRVTVRPPAGLEDGTYWTRIVTTSTPQSAPPEPANDEGVAAHIVFRLEQVTTMLYRHGRQSTGAIMEQISVAADTTGTTLLVPLMRTGNAPFLGTVTLQVRDESNRIVHESFELLALYFDLVRRFDLAAATLAPGRYTAEVTVTSDRRDIPSTDLVLAEPVSRSVTFTVP